MRMNAMQRQQAKRNHARAMQHAARDFNQFNRGQNRAGNLATRRVGQQVGQQIGRSASRAIQAALPRIARARRGIGSAMISMAQTIGPMSIKRTMGKPTPHRQGLSAMSIFKGAHLGSVLRSATKALSIGRVMHGAARMASTRTITTPRQDINRYQRQAAQAPQQAPQARQTMRQTQAMQQVQTRATVQKGHGYER